MSLFAIAMTYLKSRLSLSILHCLLMALGVGMMCLLLLMGHHLEERLYKDSNGIDAVVGAKGSPLQLILSTIQHLDIPTGNITLGDAISIEKHPKVRTAIPVSLGDSYQRFRIIGTKPAYLELYGASLANGAMWEKPMQAVIGADVARSTGLKAGDRFVGSHGIVGAGDDHADHPYQVVGVLESTGRIIDRLIITSQESVWDIHGSNGHQAHAEHEEHEEKEEHEAHNKHDEHDEHKGHEPHDEHDEHEAHLNHDKEVTAVLVQYRARAAALSFPREINRNSHLQVASPAIELTRLVEVIGLGTTTLMTLGSILVAVSLAGVIITLYNAVRERRYDLALFRTLGAPRQTIVSLVLLEGMTIALIGSLLGLALGFGGVWALGQFTLKGSELGFAQLVMLPQLFWLCGLTLLLSFAACLVPAWQVYRLNIRDMLLHGQG